MTDMARPLAAPAAQIWRAWRRRMLAMLIALAGLILFGDGLYIKAKAGVAQVLLDRAWSKTLQQGRPVRPWSWIDTWPVAQVSVPRLGATAIVLHGTSGQALAFGPGLMPEGAQPGDLGLSIMSAHRDTHFRFLKHVEIGDEITIQTADAAQHTYRIFDLRIVEAHQSGLRFDHDEALLALTTCWPFDALHTGSKRFVAIGRLVS